MRTKFIILLAALTYLTIPCTSQNQADLKNELTQIAELELYDLILNEGYSIEQKGLTAIGAYKNQEYQLHQNYFNSLMQVNPVIQSDKQIIGILDMEASIVKNFGQVISLTNFTSPELNYLQQVINHFNQSCLGSLNELATLLTDGIFQMSDEERIAGINRIYNDMIERVAFTQYFTGQALSLSKAREAGIGEAGTLKQYFNIN